MFVSVCINLSIELNCATLLKSRHKIKLDNYFVILGMTRYYHLILIKKQDKDNIYISRKSQKMFSLDKITSRYL